MIIDAFTHYSPQPYLTKLRKHSNSSIREFAERIHASEKDTPQLANLDMRLQDMEKYGIDLQVTSIHNAIDPNKLPLSPKECLELCRLVNDDASEYVEKSHNKIYTVGTVPFNSLEGEGLDEMRRAVRDLGLKGFVVLTNVRGKPIDEFRSFWREAAKLGAAVHIHPTDAAEGQTRPYESNYDLLHAFGWPYETTLALSRLVFSGVTSEFPELKIISHHMGGMIPFFAGRMSETYTPKKSFQVAKEQNVQAIKQLSKPVLEYLKAFYYDTAIGGSVPAIRCGYEVFGADRIVFATDYPFGSDGGRTRLATYPDAVKQACPDAQAQEKIFESNIRNILHI